MKKVFVLLILSLLVISTVWTQTGGNIHGTYYYDNDYRITFTGNNFTGFWGGGAISGSFTVSGSTLTINTSSGVLSPGSPRSERFTVSSDFRTIRDTFGDVWTRVFAGTYFYDNQYSFTFTGNSFSGYWDGAPVSGTFSVSGNTLTVNATSGFLSPRSPRSERFTISPNFRTIRDTFGDVWTIR